MAQYALPTANDGGGTDTGGRSQYVGTGDGDTDWFDELDEGFGAGRGSGSGPDDQTTCWRSSGVDEAGSYLQCRMGSLTDPTSSTGHVVRARVIKTSVSTTFTPSSSGQQKDVTVALYQGSTFIASATQLNVVDSWVTITLALSGAQADALSNYGDLRVRVYQVVPGGGAGRSVGITGMEIEVPDAGPPPTPTLMALERNRFRRVAGRVFGRVN